VLPLFDNIPTRRLAVVTYALIVVNVGVFVWELGARAGRIDHYAFYPCAVSGPCIGPAVGHLFWPEAALSGMFLHASWLHLIGNMLFLFIFGNNVEDVMGRGRFLLFYLAAGFTAALAQTWVTLHYAGTVAASIPTWPQAEQTRSSGAGPSASAAASFVHATVRSIAAWRQSDLPRFKIDSLSSTRATRLRSLSRSASC